MNTEPPGKNKAPWGKKGEYLVALQFLLLITFIVIPVYPSSSRVELFKLATFIRFAVLAVCWVIAILFGTTGLYQIKHSLTPLPYPVERNKLETKGIFALVRHPLYSSQLFAAFGWTVFQMSVSHFLLTAAGFLFFSYKASLEESWLTELHPEYTDYARHVNKFIPWVY